MRRTPTTFAQALEHISERPTPALIWRDGSERVELSGRVLVKWVEKSASLLVDELDVESGQLITVSALPHWRLVVLTLAALRIGAAVRVTDNSADDAAVHAELEAHLRLESGLSQPFGLLLHGLAKACGVGHVPGAHLV